MPVLIASIFLTLAALASAQSGTKRYLYLSMPDGAQKDAVPIPGILIFDIDNGHKLVRRINIPAFLPKAFGFRRQPQDASRLFLFHQSSRRRLRLETEKIVWERPTTPAADRSAITMDGKKLYVPTGWWYLGATIAEFSSSTRRTANSSRRIRSARQAHNSIVSLDGRLHVSRHQNNAVHLRYAAMDRLIHADQGRGRTRRNLPLHHGQQRHRLHVASAIMWALMWSIWKPGKVLHRVCRRDRRHIPHRIHGLGFHAR